MSRPARGCAASIAPPFHMPGEAPAPTEGDRLSRTGPDRLRFP
ncbi:hypothetical protein ACFTZK_02550 [Streptomyces decoyicus]